MAPQKCITPQRDISPADGRFKMMARTVLLLFFLLKNQKKAFQ